MSVSSLRDALESSRKRLFEKIAGLSEEQFRHVPADEQWNIAAHLAHLLRIERVYAERAAAALREDTPYVPSTRVHNDDDPALAQHLAVPQIVHGMQASRRDLVAVLDACDDARLDRGVQHETLGTLTVRQMMEKMAGHEDEHCTEVARLAAEAPAPSERVIIPLAQRS